MEMLGERPVWAMSGREKLSALDAVVAECARLKVLGAQLIAAFEESGYSKEIGAGDTARLLSQRYRIDAAEARRDVRLAVALAKHPAVAAALPDPAIPFPDPVTARPAPADDLRDDDRQADAAQVDEPVRWRVHPAQAEAIVSVLAKVPATVPAENVEFAERQLIDLAATHTPGELRLAGAKIRAILDPDGPEPDEKKAYGRESLTLKRADQGVNFNGYLANENAELFRTLIHAGAKPHKTLDGELDPRPRDKRQADALTTLLNTAANAAGLIRKAPASATAPGNATAPGDVATPGGAATTGGPVGESTPDGAVAVRPSVGADDPLPGLGGAAVSRSSGGRRSGVDEFVPGHGRKPHISVTIDFKDLKDAVATATGNLVFGEDLSAATIRRLACDAEILPIVLGSKSQPLDVGTSERFITGVMRRALNVRDKGCVVCGAPPIQCEAHHLISWIDGGVTAVSNLVLLCKRHHLDLHSGHWHIKILDGVVHVTRPTWADPSPIPRSRYRPPTIPDRPPTGGAEPETSTRSPSTAPSAPPRWPTASPSSPSWPPTESPGAPSWPRIAGPRPVGVADAVPLDPWGDGSCGVSGVGVGGSPGGAGGAARLDPWGDGSCGVSGVGVGGSPGSAAGAARLDPWGDGSSGVSGVGVGGSPRINAGAAQLDPWGDGASSSAGAAGVRLGGSPGINAGAAPLDPWGDAADGFGSAAG